MSIIFSLDTTNYKPSKKIYNRVCGIVEGTLISGKYNGKEELSILVENDDRFEEIILIARQYSQESILLIKNNKASLLYLYSRATESLGTFIEVSCLEAKASKAFTKIGKKYYVCK